MTKKPKPTPEEAVEQIAGLGSVFRGLGSFVELLGTMVEQGEALKKQGNFTPKGPRVSMASASAAVWAVRRRCAGSAMCSPLPMVRSSAMCVSRWWMSSMKAPKS